MGSGSQLRTAETKRRRTRTALLAAARALIGSNGWHVSVGDAANRVGCSEATGYNHFKTKSELFKHAFGWLTSSLDEVAQRAIGSGDDALNGVYEYLLHLARFARRRPQAAKALEAAMAHQVFAGADRPLSPAASLEALLAHARARGELTSNAPIGELANYAPAALLIRAVNLAAEPPRVSAAAVLGGLADTWAAEPMQVNPFGKDSLAYVLSLPGRGLGHLADDPLTVEYLHAGLRIARTANPDHPVGIVSLDRLLSQEAVLKEAGQVGSDAEFRRRWPGNDNDWVLDVLAYAIWTGWHAVVDCLVPETLPAEPAQGMAWPQHPDAAVMRLWLTAASVADRHPQLQQASSAARAVCAEHLGATYQEMLAWHGYTMRSGVTAYDLAEALCAMHDSFMFRLLSERPGDQAPLLEALRKAMTMTVLAYAEPPAM